MAASSPAAPVPSARASIALGCLLVWSLWAAAMAAGGRWWVLTEHWVVTATMLAGSFVAGSTTLGSGVVAFPVLTLLLGTAPATARDFALMIQAVGMSAAAATILYARIPVARRALLFSGVGAAAGLAVGLGFFAGRFSPAYQKVFFAAALASFAVCLYRINRERGRRVRLELGPGGSRRALELALVGLVGGLVAALTGTGLNTALFAYLVLRARLSEKVATPTAVVAMAALAVFGFLWQGLLAPGLGLGEGLRPEAWPYWWAAVPAVVAGAPLGARFIAGRSRLFVAGLHYAVIAAQALAALWILPFDPPLAAFALAVFAAGSLFFRSLAAPVSGAAIDSPNDDREQEASDR